MRTIAIAPRRSLLISAGLAAIATGLVPAAARADDAAPAAVQAQDAPAGGDIVVTARKRSEKLLDVPLAITALNAKALQDRGIRDLNGINDFTPGLRYENSAANRNDRSFYTVTMRGMYPGDSPNRPVVSVFLDGVPVPGGSLPGLTDLQQVEVVKGPQSAYFGRATFAGAINFITAPPSLTDYKGHADFSFESYGTTEDNVTLEGPIIRDKLAVRVTGRFYHTDGQYYNQSYGGKLGEQQTESYSVSLIGKPTDRLTLRAYFTQWQDSDGPSAQGELNEANYNCNPGGNARTVNGLNYICGGIGSLAGSVMAQNTMPGNQTNFYTLTNSGNGIEPTGFIDHMGVERREYQSYGSANWDLDSVTVSGNVGHSLNRWAVITDTYNRPVDGTGYYSAVYLPYHIEDTSAELRVATNGNGPLKAMLGSNFYHEDIFFEGRALRPNSAGVATITQLSQPTHYMDTTYGIFGSLSYDITPALNLSAEGRYQWDTIHHHIVTPGGFNQEATFRSANPRAILTYKFSPDANMYASYAHGTRPGTFNSNYTSYSASVQAQLNANAGGSIPIAVPEEKLDSYELGFKGDLFQRRVRIMIDGYYGQWRDRQINQNVAYTTNGTTSTATFTFPNGSTNLWGIEAETTVHITRALTFEGTFDWAHTKILATQCSECVAIQNVSNEVGNSMERYPQYSGTAGMSYTRPLWGDWDGMARVDYIYTGRQYAEESNLVWLDASNRFNLVIGLHNARYTIEAYGKNIFNNTVPSNILRNANPSTNVAEGANLVILAPAQKASFGLRGSVRF
jgi:iron complex outermembrane recepter protein